MVRVGNLLERPLYHILAPYKAYNPSEVWLKLWIIPHRKILHWFSKIIAVFGPIITKIWLWGPIADHMLSSNKTNCVRDHKKSDYWANFLIIRWLFMILVIIQWLSWLFSDYWWLFMIIQHKSWLFTANKVSPWNDGR